MKGFEIEADTILDHSIIRDGLQFVEKGSFQKSSRFLAYLPLEP